MILKVASDIMKKYHHLSIGVVKIHGIHTHQTSQEVKHMLDQEQQKIVKLFKGQDIHNHHHIRAWKNAYKSFGAKSSHLSSIENLVKRVLDGQDISTGNMLVDLYNLISLRYIVPVKGHDLEKISGPIKLIAAQGNESAVLLGQKEPSTAKAGEIIYHDEEGLVCRRWNWKEADRVKMSDQTQSALFLLQGVDSISKDVIEHATYELSVYLQKYAADDVQISFVSDDHISDSDFVSLASYTITSDISDFMSHKGMNHAEPEHNERSEHEVRVEKVKQLQEKGINPWQLSAKVTATAQQAHDYFDEDQEQYYTLAGRVMTIRSHGKAAFVHIQDMTGRIQVYFRQNDLGKEQFSFFKDYVDIGDIIWCRGSMFKTKVGEVTLKVDAFSLLSKSLHPLPEKFHGLTDTEKKYRQRYLDLITNKDTQDRFKKRSHIINELRSYLHDNNYLEVETPMLHPIAGGAAARPFITNHNALDSDFYLRIAPELYLKRLVIGGFERVYEINRNFRNEGVSTKHNPEFTMLEFYTAHEDYHYIMDVTEKMIEQAALKVNKDILIPFGDHMINFKGPFTRLSVKDAVKKYAHVTDQDLEEDTIDLILKKHNIKAFDHSSIGEKIFMIFEEVVESQLIQPTFIIDFPIEISPLAQKNPDNPTLANRFELYIAGMEVANGFNELNDPFDQAERFKAQLKAYEGGDEEAHHYDADYIHALEHGLPPTVGVGIGIDRLVMLLTNTTSIKEVILFPTLKKIQHDA
jgi:lysyl-tRNA synthetase class 2